MYGAQARVWESGGIKSADLYVKCFEEYKAMIDKFVDGGLGSPSNCMPEWSGFLNSVGMTKDKLKETLMCSSGKNEFSREKSNLHEKMTELRRIMKTLYCSGSKGKPNIYYYKTNNYSRY